MEFLIDNHVEISPDNYTVEVRPGHPYPLGATWDGKGVNFALYSENAESVELCLFENQQAVAENVKIGPLGTGHEVPSGIVASRLPGNQSFVPVEGRWVSERRFGRLTGPGGLVLAPAAGARVFVSQPPNYRQLNILKWR